MATNTIQLINTYKSFIDISLEIHIYTTLILYLLIYFSLSYFSRSSYSLSLHKEVNKLNGLC
jgi:hypothetical protein